MDKEQQMSISVRDFLHVVFKRKTPIVLFFGVTVCTVAIGSFMQKHTYKATAQILVKIGREDVYVPTLPAGAGGAIINREVQITAEIEILKSRFLAEKVVEFLEPGVIYGDPDSPLDEARWLQQDLSIEAVEDSNVITVGFEHENPEIAARVVNTVVDLYLDRHLEVHKSPQAHKFFQEQTQVLDSKMKQAEERLGTFKNKHDLTSLEEEQNVVLRHEAEIHTALNQTQSQQAEIENRILQLRHQLATTPETIALDEPMISSLRAKLVELELQEHELLTKYSDQSRIVQRVRDEIEIVRRKLTKRRSEVIQQELLRTEAELQTLKAKQEAQRAQLAGYRKRHEKLNRIEMEFNRLREEVDVHRRTYRLYLTKFEESRISEAMDKKRISNVSVIEPARPPLKPVSRNISRNLVLAILLGGGGGFGLALFSEHLDGSLERDEDVEYYLNLPVLASIPQLER